MYNNKNKNSFLLITLFLFLIKISPITQKEIKIFEGESFKQELQNTIISNKKLFLIFFARNCDYCGYSVRVLKERIVQHYEDNNQILFGVINLDRQSNFWIGYQFNITQIPFIILIEGGKMYQYKNQFEELNVIEFIEEEKNVEDALDIPEDVGLNRKINFFMANLIQKVSNLFIRFGFSYKWSNYLSCILLLFILINLIYLEHKLLNWIRKVVQYLRYRKKDKAGNDINIESNKEEIKENEYIKEKKD